jgi:hypothetical protein
MSQLRRGMIVDINLDPTQGSETGKIRSCVKLAELRQVTLPQVVDDLGIQPPGYV